MKYGLKNAHICAHSENPLKYAEIRMMAIHKVLPPPEKKSTQMSKWR